MELSELKIVPIFARDAVCCFTGNRPHKLPWGKDEGRPECAALKRRITDAVIALAGEGYRLFVCGMALGADIYFAESVLEAKKTVPEIYLECAVPCPEQTGRLGCRGFKAVQDGAGAERLYYGCFA